MSVQETTQGVGLTKAARRALASAMQHIHPGDIHSAAQLLMDESADRQGEPTGIGLEYAYALRDISLLLTAAAEAIEEGKRDGKR
jgi:hypothetical protein